MIEQPLVIIFTYYLIDVLRCLSILILIVGSRVFGILYIVLQINEFLGLAAIGINYYYRYF